VPHGSSRAKAPPLAADARHARQVPLVDNNSSQFLWVGMHFRDNKSQQSGSFQVGIFPETGPGFE